MPFVRGKSGNPHGRPKRGDSLAELTRHVGGTDKLRMVKLMWAIAADDKDRTNALKAAEWCAKHGWPHEQKGDVNLTLPDATSVKIVHEHLP